MWTTPGATLAPKGGGPAAAAAFRRLVPLAGGVALDDEPAVAGAAVQRGGPLM